MKALYECIPRRRYAGLRWGRPSGAGKVRWGTRRGDLLQLRAYIECLYMIYHQTIVHRSVRIH